MRCWPSLSPTVSLRGWAWSSVSTKARQPWTVRMRDSTGHRFQCGQVAQHHATHVGFDGQCLLPLCHPAAMVGAVCGGVTATAASLQQI